MPTPKAELILQNLETSFAVGTIVAGFNGFLSTVRRVERPMRADAQVPPAECPYIGIARGEEVLEDLPGRVRCSPFEILIRGIVHGSNRTTTRAALTNLEHDIKRAIYLDVTRGANPDVIGDHNAIRSRIARRKIEDLPDETLGVIHIGIECVYEELPTGV
jgi:hypothetical protein